jgi:hypothetical protein
MQELRKDFIENLNTAFLADYGHIIINHITKKWNLGFCQINGNNI